MLVDGDIVVDEWEGSAGEKMQAIPGVEGSEGSYVTVQGLLEVGEYLGILEVCGNLRRYGWLATM